MCRLIQFCSLLAIPFAFLCSGALAQNADKAFTITIDGKDAAIDAGETIKLKSDDGKEISVTLTRNPEVAFSGNHFTFRHSSDYKVATTPAADDIDQHIIVTGLGTIILVQEYRLSDPTTLTKFMMDELTADDVRGGGTVESVEFSRKLVDGSTISGFRGRVKTVSDEAEMEVLAAKTRDGGIIAVSRIDLANVELEQAFIDKFWSTLSLK
jgi:hypothetical protein